MNARVTIPPKVVRSIPLLGSDTDGDVLAAARGIGRTLNGARLDWHDLAASIGRIPDQAVARNDAHGFEPPKPTTGPKSYGDWRPKWAKRHRRHRWFTPAQERVQRQQIRFCRIHSDRLGSRERDFIQNISSIRDGLTVAQADWLTDLVDRLDSETRA